MSIWSIFSVWLLISFVVARLVYRYSDEDSLEDKKSEATVAFFLWPLFAFFLPIVAMGAVFYVVFDFVITWRNA